MTNDSMPPSFFFVKVGDLGNITADENGVAQVHIEDTWYGHGVGEGHEAGQGQGSGEGEGKARVRTRARVRSGCGFRMTSVPTTNLQPPSPLTLTPNPNPNPSVKLIGPHSVIGRSIIVKEGEDDLGRVSPPQLTSNP
jgi:hypothetical protein